MDMEKLIAILDVAFRRFGQKSKIRRVYDISAYIPDALMIVTTDAISAFDFVMLNNIPGKGIVLNEISAWWFRKTARICDNHFITDSIRSRKLPRELRDILSLYKDALNGRVMFVKKTRPLPAEFIVRRYLLGSAWESYQKDGTVCGIRLRPGLKKGARLEELLFTPSTKAEFGEHDVNITYEELEKLLGPTLANDIRVRCIALFEYAEKAAAKKGLTLQDTKFEFGVDDIGRILLIDELFTPDNSRWTPDYTKQPFRDALIWSGYQKTGPVMLGIPIITITQRNYANALYIITGKTLAI